MKRTMIMALIAVALGACKKEDVEPIKVCGCYNYSREVWQSDNDWALMVDRKNSTYTLNDTIQTDLGTMVGKNYDDVRWYKNDCGDSTLVWFSYLGYTLKSDYVEMWSTQITEEQETLFLYPTVCEPSDSLIY